MNSDQRILLGERSDWGDARPFGISPADQRQHVYALGKTGAGKTTLLRNMILQHILQGHGVGFIDPHGDLAEELLNHIPPARTSHFCYFNPADLDFPIALNVLTNVASDHRHLVSSGIVGAFKSIWRDSWGPRLEYILHNAVSALLECQNTSLLGVNRMLVDQLSLPVRQAVFGNVGTLIAFRTGHADAEILEKEFGKTFRPELIADLERYEAVIKLLEDGTNRTPFRAKMLPPMESPVGRPSKLIASSRERFATPRGMVEAALNRWMK